jgi:hypothetical protein
MAGIGNVVMFCSAVFAFISSISIFAGTNSSFIASQIYRSLGITRAGFTSWEIEGSDDTCIAVITDNIRIAETVSGCNITVVIYGSFSIT